MGMTKGNSLKSLNDLSQLLSKTKTDQENNNTPRIQSDLDSKLFQWTNNWLPHIVPILLIATLSILTLSHNNSYNKDNTKTDLTTNLSSLAEYAQYGTKPPRIEDAINHGLAHQRAIQSLQTSPTATNDEIKAQGFVIRPVDNYQRRYKPDFTANKKIPQINTALPSSISSTSSTSSALDGIKTSIASIYNQIETTANSHKTQDSIFPSGHQPHYYSMDSTSRSILLNSAKTLSIGTPRTMAKKVLGRPTKETIVALPESRDLTKMLVYTTKIYRQGVTTPDKDENLILLFDPSDRLVSLELNTGGSYAQKATDNKSIIPKSFLVATTSTSSRF